MLKLRLLTGPRAGRQLRVSDTKPVSIGRRKGRLRLYDSRVSKNHAEIYFDNDAWLLRDLDSANGTYVNRRKAEGLVELESGDMVQMGRVLMKIVRCDGIGMDTQPALPDEVIDDVLGIGAAVDEPSEAEDDFDLDAIFNESPASDLGVASDDAPQAVEAEPGNDREADEPVPELLEVAFDEPVDDDDSFFADLGEATDTSDGVDVAVEPEQLEQPQLEEEDPFLSGEQEQEEQPDDTSDQISLDDESGMGPSSAGTTLLTTVSHDELVIDEDDASSDDLFDSGESVEDKAEPLQGVDEDADDQAPALVGLHLDHAPPQQPETVEEHDEVEEAKADDVEAEAASVVDEQEQFGLEPERSQPPVPEQEEIVASADDDTAAQSVDEPEQEIPATAIEDIAIEQEPESGDAVELGAELEPEPELAAEHEAEEPGFEIAPVFDIDAAFDALSEGLDDSVELPAIGSVTSDESKASPDVVQEPVAEQQTDEPQGPDSLVGSQLDVDFIKDALAKLEESEMPEQDPPADDTSPKASAAPALPPTMPPAAPPSAEPSVQHPPPGINPSSISPSADLRPSDPPRGGGPGMGRWFLLLLLFLGVGGVGGWLISENYDKLIAGRGDAASTNSATPAAPVAPINPIANPPERGTTSTQPADTTPPVGAQPDPATPTQPTGPNPFAAGPGVLGPDALDGITRGSDPNRPLDPPQPPSTTNPSGPGSIVQPPAVPNATNPNSPTANDPQAVVPGDDTTPVADAPPARIVFLIDASGSLVDSLPQMVVWLNEALQTVEPNERFAVYFFKADKPIAIKPAGMLAPSRELLSQLGEDWLNPDAVPVFPSGRSNPAKAIAQAMSHKPTDLYLLSDDAFAMYAGGTTAPQAIDLVTQALGDNQVRVHGVQFFYRGDNNVLETLANQTSGTFEFVSERVVPDADPIDLLEELGGE